MIKISFPDGAVREYDAGVTAMDVAKSISEGLARNVLAAEVDGEVWDATRPIQSDARLKLFTWKDDQGKATYWHSSAHLMAEALEALYPGTKFGIGPAIDNGFYYDVQERGATLSVGQRQLISFVRAMVYNPQILILDEATSSVDSETEELIQNAIDKMMEGRTAIVIAHRLATIQKADKIMVLDKGEIKESGSHEELIKLGGYYNTLYEMQFLQAEKG